MRTIMYILFDIHGMCSIGGTTKYDLVMFYEIHTILKKFDSYEDMINEHFADFL